MFPADSQVQAFYGGRMTDDRLLAVKNATCEAIDHLHKSLETCPDAEADAPDPKGIKVRHSFSHYYDTANDILIKLQGMMLCFFVHSEMYSNKIFPNLGLSCACNFVATVVVKILNMTVPLCTKPGP